jgi:restriction system protein
MKLKIQQWLNNIMPSFFAHSSDDKKNIGNIQDSFPDLDDAVKPVEPVAPVNNTQDSFPDLDADQIRKCPNCGIKNKIPTGKPLYEAKCGKCKQSLNEVDKRGLPQTESARDLLKEHAERKARAAGKQTEIEARVAKEQAERKAKQEAEKQTVRERERMRQELFNRNKDLVEKFLQIAERKVSIIDDYGDENWGILPDEILTCLKKISQRENSYIDWKGYSKKGYLPDAYGWLRDKLKNIFIEYHKECQSKASTIGQLHNMSGVEFEVWVVKVLKENGFDDVRGTPASGDQGADIIAKKDGRIIIIQTKRNKGAVGNKAVQEVISALQYYSGDEGWVITNSTFTSSAKALAQKSNIKLIDGKALLQFKDYIN